MTKGIQSMLDVCPHCHQMVYKILYFRMIRFCIHCNKDIW